MIATDSQLHVYSMSGLSRSSYLPSLQDSLKIPSAYSTAVVTAEQKRFVDLQLKRAA